MAYLEQQEQLSPRLAQLLLQNVLYAGPATEGTQLVQCFGRDK